MKIALFAVWFGNKPAYWDAWIISLRHISDRFHFFLITDMKLDDSVASMKNLEIIQMTLEQFKKKIESSLHRKVNLKKAYRICDFKPMFGDIFIDLLTGGVFLLGTY